MSEGGDTLLDGWTEGTFSAAGFTRRTFRRGEGPGVVVVHEIPGITPKVRAFAEDVVAAGFTVVMPSLVGDPGREISIGYALRSITRVCIAKEFTNLALRRTSPIISWLRALATELHASCGGPGVGAVGMCFSGGFALGMMVDERMIAPVLSQPSSPFAIGKARAADLDLSPDDRLAVAQRAADGCEVLGLRFDRDMAVGTRFRTLHDLLGERFIAVELPSRKRTDHSVLTEQRDEASVSLVIEFLTAKLRPEA